MTDFSHDPAHLVPANSTLRRSRRLWRVLFFLALAVAAIAVAGRFALEAGVPGDRIARVSITGTILSDPARLAMLERIGEEQAVKAVIVAINSPGGTTAGGEELYEALSVLRGKKPVVAVISELGASAAYMTAIAADRIVARRLSIVGSIGVFYQHVNAGKLMETIGVDYDKVQTGPLKAEPDINEPLAGPARVSLQALVDDSFQWFVDIVSERRGIPRPETVAVADGRIVTGRQALALKLIDTVGGEAEAISWLEAERQLAADLPVIDYAPPSDGGLFGLKRFLGDSARQVLGLGAAGGIALDGLVSLWQAGPPM